MNIKNKAERLVREFSTLYPIEVDKNKEWDGRVLYDTNELFIEKETLFEILNSKYPHAVLEEVIREKAFYELDDLVNSILVHVQEEEYADEIKDWLLNNLIVDIDTDSIIKRHFVPVNVSVDTGDWNYDYTLNADLVTDEGFLPDNYKDGAIPGVLWLTRQQGYKDKELAKAIRNGSENKFLDSVVDELLNMGSSMGKLVFLTELNAQEYLELKNKEHENLILPKNTTCGIVNYWLGGGSMLNIALEKDVAIPIEQLNLNFDGEEGYAISEIYGDHDLWHS